MRCLDSCKMLVPILKHFCTTIVSLKPRTSFAACSSICGYLIFFPKANIFGFCILLLCYFCTISTPATGVAVWLAIYGYPIFFPKAYIFWILYSIFVLFLLHYCGRHRCGSLVGYLWTNRLIICRIFVFNIYLFAEFL